ncbi:MAG: phosphoribosyl-AMP cyclohydrolase [Candidatus Saccharicenans sp.]|uniref:phosphoribosyl-AMP cyclohydrolase n=1 Tax=Candidatus Saccharicenans sp. TaxID=2819258 RepID=UPI004049041C
MIISSIDLMQGKAVQLKQGKEKLLESDKVLDLAREFSRFGPLAVIDLDAVFENGSNEELIGQLCQLSDCRVGGGIRDVEKARRILDLGAEKIIIGTAAWKGDGLNRTFLQRMISSFGRHRIILALDCYKEEVVIGGWSHKTGINIFSLLPEVNQLASELLITCVEKEGCLQGTDVEFFKKIRVATDLPVTAAGGISSLEEIAVLGQLGIDVQLGMAIYSRKLKLEEALIASLNWSLGTSGLLPAVVVDEVGRVLMLAWISPESLRRTFGQGRTCFYSRSRKTLWTKGETSGFTQQFLQIRVDCDSDTVLLKVKQDGTGACHRGNYSCFGAREFRLEDLYLIVEERIKNYVSGSYTAELTDKTVREKLKEEAIELIEARGKKEIIWEAADLLYFLTVLLVREQVDIKDIFWELARRRRKKSVEEAAHLKNEMRSVNIPEQDY